MTQFSDDEVRRFILRELPMVTTLFMKKVSIDNDSALQELYEAEDVAEMATRFFHFFHVRSDAFSLTNYYPWHVRRSFTQKLILQDKAPLTIGMFIASAQAGYWLYQ